MSKSINLDAEDRRVRFLQDLLLRKSGRSADADPGMGPRAGATLVPGMVPAAGSAGDEADVPPQDGAAEPVSGAAPEASASAIPAGAGSSFDFDGPTGSEEHEEEPEAEAELEEEPALGNASEPEERAAEAPTQEIMHEAPADEAPVPAGSAAPEAAFAPIARIEPVAPNPDAPSAEEAAAAAVAAADQARAARRSKQRTRTRLIGFDASGPSALDPLAGQAVAEAPAATAASVRFPVGWIVVIDGPGRGESFSLASGLNQIGRGEEQQVRLDFGDDTISRENHASIAFDEESRTCYLGHGGKSNLVRRNGRPVLSTEELGDGDVIRVGETTLKFKALCGADFSWSDRSKVTRLANG